MKRIFLYGCLVTIGFSALLSLAFFQTEDSLPQVDSVTTTPQNSLHPAVQLAINERVERYRKRLLRDCRREVLEEAIARVDSIIIANAKRIKDLPVDRPPKPIRPREDGSPVSFDSTKVEPLWNLDSLLYEQLLRREALKDSLLMTEDSLLVDSLLRDSLRLDSLLDLSDPKQ